LFTVVTLVSFRKFSWKYVNNTDTYLNKS
jgi:hypothetical protein